MDYKLINMKVFGDERGKLVSLEANKNIPFNIKRVYYIYDTLPEQERGKHSHKELEQIIIAIDGSCQFLLDDGKERKEIWLNRPDVGLYIGKKIWREMRHFSYGCKLMILASEYYNPNEYIKNYDDFLKEVEHER
jgi:dTDP-4-dehydrorhamnose 3,5-epimerase-like enzyme